MGHCSDYYEEQAEKSRKYRRVQLKMALKDLTQYRYYKAAGKTGAWTFNEIGLEKEYNDLVDKVKARLYDLQDVEID